MAGPRALRPRGVPAIHVFASPRLPKTWRPGIRPGMTMLRTPVPGYDRARRALAMVRAHRPGLLPRRQSRHGVAVRGGAWVAPPQPGGEIGRASCRERVLVQEVGGTSKRKRKKE